MTLNVGQVGNLVAVGKRLTTTAETTIYAASRGMRPCLDTLNIANVTGADVTATVRWYDASAATSFTLVMTVSIAAAARLTIADVPLSLREDDELRVTAGTADALDVIAVLIEATGASR